MFTVYTASAGSGKTSRLVVEYLALALPNPKKFKHILAITFTNNATAEMKGRILETLHLFAFSQPSDFNSSLKATFLSIKGKIDPTTLALPFDLYIQKQSKELLQEILYDYDNFAISTIDTFFQRILRAFSFELGISMNYSLEIQLDELHQQTVDLLLNKLSVENKELSKRVLNLVETKIEDSGKWKIEKDLLNLLGNMFNEDAYISIKELEKFDKATFDASSQKILLTKRATKKEIEEIKREYVSLIEVNNLDPKLFQKPLKTPENFDADQLYMDVEKKYKKGIPSEIESLWSTIIPLLTLLKEKSSLLKEIQFFGKNLSQLALLIDLKTVIEEIKTQDNLFYLSETNGIIHEEVKDEEAPYLYEKLGNKYSYFFLDEFQDTSKLQWENLLPLIKNALSGQNEFNEMGKVFLFGDIKQAIYRFRNGDSSLLHNLSQIETFRQLVNPYAVEGEHFELQNLGQNYRSSQSIVHFNNSFFENWIQDLNTPTISSFYKDVEQTVDSSREKGYVSIQFMEKKDKNGEDEKVEPRDYLLSETLQTVQSLINEGYNFGDIAVLVSSNDLGSSMGEWLSENNIPVISPESLLLSSSDEVMLLISTLHYLNNSNNKLARLLMGHFLVKSNPELKIELFKNIEEETLFLQFLNRSGIQFSKKRLMNIPLFTLINELISLFGLTQKNPFVITLLNKTEEYLKAGNGSLKSYLDWWSEKSSKLALSSPSHVNAVTISTIHKAKGLAYPIVILPFTQYGNQNTKELQWIKDEKGITGLPYSWVSFTNNGVPEQYEEQFEMEKQLSLLDKINKLYVAHTRPKERLYIITQASNKGNYSKFLYNFIKNRVSEEDLEKTRYWFDGENFSCEPPEFNAPKKKDSPFSVSNPEVDTDQIYVSNFKIDAQFLAFERTKTTTEEQERGIQIHDFLSTLRDFPQTEIQIDEIIAHLSPTIQPYLKKVLHKLVSDIEYAPYFKPQVEALNETTIISETGELLRPDRVVFVDNQVVVIDYKTGTPTIKHQEQIDQYCLKLKEMGYPHVEGKLIYL